MRPVSHSLVEQLPASIDRVFAVLADPARVPDWLPGCSAAQSDGPLQNGARLRVRFKKRVSEFEVRDYAPPRSFGLAERGQRKSSELLFGLESRGGSTTVTVREIWSPTSPGAWVRGRLIPRRNPRRYLATILENLRRIVTPPDQAP